MLPNIRYLLIISYGLISITVHQSFAIDDDSYGRLNTKHLNRIFTRLSAFIPTTSKTVERNRYESMVTNSVKKMDTSSNTTDNRIQLRREETEVVDGTEPSKPNLTNVSSWYRLNQKFNVHLNGLNESTSPTNEQTTKAPTEVPATLTPIYRPTTMPAPMATIFATTTTVSSSSHIDETIDMERHYIPSQLSQPTQALDQCKCVCRNNDQLETYDIRLEELKLKILQSELMFEANKSTHSLGKIEDILDSLVDEDESDYDDIDELEQIKRPTKYIPLEMIELSHRRPPRKPNSPPSVSVSSNPQSTTTTNRPIVTYSTRVPSNSAPLYSMSFQKPNSSSIKFLAYRMAQVGIPLLVTIALGNVLTSVDPIVARSEQFAIPNNYSVNPFDYMGLIQTPNMNKGYFGQLYTDSITPHPMVQHQRQDSNQNLQFIQQNDQQYPINQPERQRMESFGPMPQYVTYETRINRDYHSNHDPWNFWHGLFQRWFDRFRNL